MTKSSKDSEKKFPKEIHITEGDQKKKDPLTKDKKRKKWILISSLSLVVLLCLAGVCLWASGHLPPGLLSLFSKKKIKISSEEPKFPSLLTGELKTKDKADLRPYAIVIENHPESRPQSGLADAGLVYESLTEGGITRYLAFFDELPNTIGPVRSARTFFVDWAHELPAFFVHCGGNADALEKIQTLSGFFNLDEFAYGNYFWRDNTRFAPHNLYTSNKLLTQLTTDQKWQTNLSYPAWNFKDEIAETERGTFKKVTINFSGPEYEVSYIYDKKTNNYKRYLAGVIHKDLNGEEITVKNVVLATYSGQLVPDPADNTVSWQLQTDQGGKAIILLDGKKITGTWQKADDTRTRFFDQTGREVKFNRGNTWIEALAPVVTTAIE